MADKDLLRRIDKALAETRKRMASYTPEQRAELEIKARRFMYRSPSARALAAMGNLAAGRVHHPAPVRQDIIYSDEVDAIHDKSIQVGDAVVNRKYGGPIGTVLEIRDLLHEDAPFLAMPKEKQEECRNRWPGPYCTVDFHDGMKIGHNWQLHELKNVTDIVVERNLCR